MFKCLYPKCPVIYKTRKEVRKHIRVAHKIKPVEKELGAKIKTPSAITKYHGVV